MAIVTIDGVDLFVESEGGGAPALVLHGGLGLDHMLYRRTLARLARRLELVFFDMRGNGRSGRVAPDRLTMERLADDAHELVGVLGVGPVIAVGHSYGGFVAQELALRHPATLRGLVLVDTTPGQLGTDEPGDDDQGAPPPPGLVELFASEPRTDEEMGEMMARLLPYYLPYTDPATVAPLLEGMIFDVATMARSMEVLGGWSSIDRLASIDVPTLVIAGDTDHFTSASQAARIARRIPEAELRIIERAGHMPWIERPDEFFATVEDWLDQLEGARSPA